MRIYAADPNVRIRDAGSFDCVVSACNRAFYKAGLDARDCIDEPDVRGYVQHLQFRGSQHHRDFRCSCEVCKGFRVTRESVAGGLQGFLIQRRCANGGDPSAHGEARGELEISIGRFASFSRESAPGKVGRHQLEVNTVDDVGGEASPIPVVIPACCGPRVECR